LSAKKKLIILKNEWYCHHYRLSNTHGYHNYRITILFYLFLLLAFLKLKKIFYLPICLNPLLRPLYTFSSFFTPILITSPLLQWFSKLQADIIIIYARKAVLNPRLKKHEKCMKHCNFFTPSVDKFSEPLHIEWIRLSTWVSVCCLPGSQEQLHRISRISR